jgi:two-component system chemotaxis response regulator CheB
LPIAIAQHLANGFSKGFAGWLSRDTGFPVEICDRPRTLQAGTVYLAADNQHLMLLSPTQIGPSPEPDTIRYRPSIDQLFSSAAKAYGANIAAVILSGMGNDGEKGARTLQAAGALCIAQHPDTCVIDSMPAHAIKKAGVDQILTPAAIAAMLARLGESYGSNPSSSQNAQRKSGSSK